MSARALGTVGLLVLVAAGAASPAGAAPQAFEAGSLIVPMDTDYQDHGMLAAFGLVYALLKADVPVQWVIAPDKAAGGADFVASAADHPSGAAVTLHRYRGGPFVVDAAHAARAVAVVDAWQALHPKTAVHVATEAFTGDVSKSLVAAPTIAVFADGNENIAFGYLNAAGIPDSLGHAWPTAKQGSYAAWPDVVTVAQVAGPTTTNHADGALFDESGTPVYCQLMLMHWGVGQVVDEAVAEIRQYLQHPVHLFAECQAVNAIENNVNGRFLTPNGFRIDAKPSAVQFRNAGYPFAQMDGPFGIAGGSEPSYSLPPGDAYYDKDVVMITSAGSDIGTQDVWMTGYVDGACMMGGSLHTGDMDPRPTGPRDAIATCTSTAGKVSYLGGHSYGLKLPLSANPSTQGTRLFLNSLFEAQCATAEGQPYLWVTKEGPATVTGPEAAYTIRVKNFGPGSALNAVLSDDLPAGASLLSATGSYAIDPGTGGVRWTLGNLGPGDGTSVDVTASLAAPGTYENQAEVTYTVGLNQRTVSSGVVTTVYDADPDGDQCPDVLEGQLGTDPLKWDTDGDGAGDCVDVCPLQANPLQDLRSDPAHCGDCATACVAEHATMACGDGDCVAVACDEGWVDLPGAAVPCGYACVAAGGESPADGACDDGEDDDCDGLTDLEDPGCIPVPDAGPETGGGDAMAPDAAVPDASEPDAGEPADDAVAPDGADAPPADAATGDDPGDLGAPDAADPTPDLADLPGNPQDAGSDAADADLRDAGLPPDATDDPGATRDVPPDGADTTGTDDAPGLADTAGPDADASPAGGGCGCRTTGGAAPPGEGALLLALVLCAFLWRRRGEAERTAVLRTVRRRPERSLRGR